jgi:hypothetical protein
MNFPYASKGCIGSDKARGIAFRQAADAVRIKTMSLKPGKGSKNRTLPSDEYREEHDRIFKKNKIKRGKLE